LTSDTLNLETFTVEHSALEIPAWLEAIDIDLYSGESDLKEHLASFNTRMTIHGATEVYKCHLLPHTLNEEAAAWFESLPLRSVRSFIALMVYLMRIGVNDDNIRRDLMRNAPTNMRHLREKVQEVVYLRERECELEVRRKEMKVIRE
jgi:hypothetical protein